MFRIYFTTTQMTLTFAGTQEAVLAHVTQALKNSLCREAIITDAKTGWVLFTVTKD